MRTKSLNRHELHFPVRATRDLLPAGGDGFPGGGPVTCPVDDPAPQEGAHVHLRDLPDRFFVRAPDEILLFQAGKIQKWRLQSG
jgi:hypothetical protein